MRNRTASVRRPPNAETSADATLANYPDLLYLLHKDDAVAGESSFTPRVGTAVPHFTESLARNDYGITCAGFVDYVDGEMPILSAKYFLLLHVAHAPAGAHSNAMALGYSLNNAIEHNGQIDLEGSFFLQDTGWGSLPSTGLAHCDAMYTDWVDTTLPFTTHRAFATPDGTVALGSSGYTGTPTATPNSLLGTFYLDQQMDIDMGQGFVMLALFGFSSPKTLQEIKNAALLMAGKPGTLPVWWRR